MVNRGIKSINGKKGKVVEAASREITSSTHRKQRGHRKWGKLINS